MELVRSETGSDPERMTRVLSGLRRYQEAPRPRGRAMPVLAEQGGARIRDYGGDGPTILFVPSLINPPSVLDLPRRSLLRWMRQRGRRVLLLDWGQTSQERHGLSIADHVEQLLLPLLRGLGGPVDLVGYCLGGTMALAAAQLTPTRSVALIAAPWLFSGFGPDERSRLAALWKSGQGMADQMGVLPMEVLQSGFWMLDASRTVAKFEAFAAMDETAARGFVALEDWANDGPPLSAAAARELFEDFFAADLPGGGGWRVGGQIVDPATLTCPLLNIVSTVDRIVPYASASAAGKRLELARGHVGMVVGSQARTALWQPLARWLSQVSPAC